MNTRTEHASSAAAATLLPRNPPRSLGGIDQTTPNWSSPGRAAQRPNRCGPPARKSRSPRAITRPALARSMCAAGAYARTVTSPQPTVYLVAGLVGPARRSPALAAARTCPATADNRFCRLMATSPRGVANIGRSRVPARRCGVAQSGPSGAPLGALRAGVLGRSTSRRSTSGRSTPRLSRPSAFHRIRADLHERRGSREDQVQPTLGETRTRSVATMPAPHWFFRFMYDRESSAWERRRDEPQHHALVERTADELANVVPPPGPGR